MQYRQTYIHIHGCGFATEMTPKISKEFYLNLDKVDIVRCGCCGKDAPKDEFVWEYDNKSLNDKK